MKNDLSRLSIEINKRLAKLVDISLMKILGDFARELIIKRTRLGYGVVIPEAEKTRLKPLKESYIEVRKKDKKKGRLFNETTPRKSNLTRTGQMLDSIRYWIRDNGYRKAIELFVPDSRRNDGRTNNEVAGHVQSNGRIFFNLSKQEKTQIKRLAIKELRARIKK